MTATEKRSVYSMQRRFGVKVGAVVLGFAGALGVGPSVAAAETADMDIQASTFAGAFHVYEHDDFNGSSATFTATDRNLSNNSWRGEPGRILNNNISSVKNRTNRDIVLYNTSRSCAGDAYLSRKNSVDKDLTNNGFDNKASCIQFG